MTNRLQSKTLQYLCTRTGLLSCVGMIHFLGLIGAAFSEQPMETRAPNSGTKLSYKDPMPFSELKKTGFERSRYPDFDPVDANTRGENPPQPNLLEFVHF